MEFLIVIAALSLLGPVANRYGHDSREHPASIEEVLAGQGGAWHGERP